MIERPTLEKICKDIDTQILPKKELEAYMGILGFRFIGQHKVFRVYGSGINRVSYKELKENRFKLFNKYQSNTYIKPLEIHEYK